MSGVDDIPARLVWQCRRGMRELDLLLEGFLESAYPGLDAGQREAFARLLDYPDQLLFDYLLGGLSPSDPAIADLVGLIRSAAAGHDPRRPS